MNRGDVVEVDWQFSDLTGNKKWPAVVVQADFLNGLLDDTILVKITGSRYGIPGTEVAAGGRVAGVALEQKKGRATCVARPLRISHRTRVPIRTGFWGRGGWPPRPHITGTRPQCRTSHR
jgi:hypothetical protein